MTAQDLLQKFVSVNLDADVPSLEDAEIILNHLTNPEKTPAQAFNSKYWTFLSTDQEVLRDFVIDYVDSWEDEEVDYDNIINEWEDYLDSALDDYCEQENLSLIAEEDTFVFVSNELIDKGYVNV